jgi:hypothetical protein
MAISDNSGDKREFFMLVRKGRVQRYSVGAAGPSIWPIAETFGDAKRLCEWFGGPSVRAARIGSVSGESLEGHLKLAIEDGCVAVYCVAGWHEDGSPQWKYIPIG